MRFGTYMIIGSLIGGLAYSNYAKRHHTRCPKEGFELGWEMTQLAVVWPGILMAAALLPADLPHTPCKE